jgi:hypothetical protein
MFVEIRSMVLLERPCPALQPVAACGHLDDIPEASSQSALEALAL